jgi:hypothetical protein
MAKERKTMVDLEDEAVKRILSALLAEFKQRKLGALDLDQGYEGLSPAYLKETCCNDGRVTEVDFDLAIKGLTDAEFVKTGPMKMYDNDPNSSVMIVAFYSANEFTYLAEAGYKLALKLNAVKAPRPSIPHVHISGGTFHHSPPPFSYRNWRSYLAKGQRLYGELCGAD